jgi:hypothetical protein
MPDKGAGRVSDMALLTPIKAIHAETRGAYGWPRIWRELRQRNVRGTWSETPVWFQTKLSAAPNASITLSFSDVSDTYQFFPSPLRSLDNLDCRANPPHGRNTDISCR